jgi:methionyl-tRNA synthetase
VLYTTAEVLRRVGILCLAFIPQSADKLLDLLGVKNEDRTFAHLTDGWLKPGAELPAPQGIFPRYVEQEAQDA